VKKKIILLLLAALCVYFPISVYGADITLAVLNFENNSLFGSENYNALSKGLAEIMITELSQVQSIHIVERRKLQSLLDELKLSQAGFIEAENSIQVGKMLGAQHMVFGGFIVTLDNKIRIDVRIVNVESGVTVKADQITGNTKQILSLIGKLGKKIVKGLDVQITSQEDRSLDNNQKIDLDAILHFSQALEYEDSGNLELASENYQKALQIEPDFLQAQKNLDRLKTSKGE
jgi:TolB-like protein